MKPNDVSQLWKPIASSPKDTRILIWNEEDGEADVGYFSEKLGRWYAERWEDNLKQRPLFWMPLPRKPNGESIDET